MNLKSFQGICPKSTIGWCKPLEGDDRKVHKFEIHPIIESKKYFVNFYEKKKKNIFLRNQEILCFLCVLDPGRHFTKKASSGQNLNLEKFQFQIISLPLYRSTSYLVKRNLYYVTTV